MSFFRFPPVQLASPRIWLGFYRNAGAAIRKPLIIPEGPLMNRSSSDLCPNRPIGVAWQILCCAGAALLVLLMDAQANAVPLQIVSIIDHPNATETQVMGMSDSSIFGYWRDAYDPKTGLGIARCPARFHLVPALDTLNSPPVAAPPSAPDRHSALPTANTHRPDPPTSIFRKPTGAGSRSCRPQ